MCNGIKPTSLNNSRLASVSPALAVIIHFLLHASFMLVNKFSFELSKIKIGAPVSSLIVCSYVPFSSKKYDPLALA